MSITERIFTSRLSIVLLSFVFSFQVIYSQEIYKNPKDSLKSRIYYLKENEQTSPVKHQDIRISETQIRQILDNEYPFAVYNDTYIVTGIPLNKKIDHTTADVFFQFSIRHRLTRSVLPFNSFLYLTYSQKTLWNAYDNDSGPFRDLSFNPGIGLGRYIIKDYKLKGAAMISLEHESNGKDSIDSRSWNFINLSFKYFYNEQISLKAMLWLPYIDGTNNRDLLKYKGYGNISINYIDRQNLWWISMKITPRNKFINPNIHTSISYRLSKKSNQYLTLDFYNGYGESLLNYKHFSSKLRIGFTIKPDFFSAY